jgi:plastocyanin
MTYRTYAVLLMTGVLLAGAGCKKQPISEGQPAATASYTQIDWNTAGTISGTIHYAKKLPPAVSIDMAQDPACNLGPTNFSEQYVGKNGGLQNVFIYVKDGLGNKLYVAPSTPVVMDQKGCRYSPHVVGVMVGQQVHFTNSDPTMHNIHMVPTVGGNQTVDISQGPNGEPQQHIFSQPELMIPVRCNNHPWMQAFINVAANPFFAVSDESGHFEIKGLPPGTYTVVADHEELGQKTATVTVAAKQTAAQDFTYGDGSGAAAQ